MISVVQLPHFTEQTNREPEQELELPEVTDQIKDEDTHLWTPSQSSFLCPIPSLSTLRKTEQDRQTGQTNKKKKKNRITCALSLKIMPLLSYFLPFITSSDFQVADAKKLQLTPVLSHSCCGSCVTINHPVYRASVVPLQQDMARRIAVPEAGWEGGETKA